jgi:hypothetical protein
MLGAGDGPFGPTPFGNPFTFNTDANGPRTIWSVGPMETCGAGTEHRATAADAGESNLGALIGKCMSHEVDPLSANRPNVIVFSDS